MAEHGHNPLAPSGQIGIEGLAFQTAQRQGHDGLAVHGKCHGGRVRVNTCLSEPSYKGYPFLGGFNRRGHLGFRPPPPGDRIDPADSGAVSLGQARPPLNIR
jgi:hypothetical protein